MDCERGVWEVVDEGLVEGERKEDRVERMMCGGEPDESGLVRGMRI